MKIRRGEIYMTYLEKTCGSVQYGERPVLIIQNNKGNKYSPTTIVAPITSRLGKSPLPTHIDIISSELPKKSIILLEQITTISADKLGKRICKLSKRQMTKINLGIDISCGTTKKRCHNHRIQNTGIKYN